MKKIIDALRVAKLHSGHHYYGAGIPWYRKSKAQTPPSYFAFDNELYDKIRTALVNTFENVERYYKKGQAELEDDKAADIAERILGSAVVDASHHIMYAVGYFKPKDMSRVEIDDFFEQNLDYERVASDCVEYWCYSAHVYGEEGI